MNSANQRVPQWRPLHIAMIGQKGLPATYGGIEHHVEQVGERLAERGHRVTVFNRSSYGDAPTQPYRGMHVRNAPTIASKHFDAIAHSAASTWLALRSSCDVLHYHALGPGLVAPLPRYASRSGVALTVHGLDHERGKWNASAQFVLGLAHYMSARVPDETIVVSRVLQEHYQSRFGKRVHYVSNGVVMPEPVSVRHLTEFGLEPNKYILFVGRIVPEKAPAELLEAFRGVDTDVKLVIAGDSSFSDDYTEELRRLAGNDPRVRLLGFVHGEPLRALYQHTRLFVQPSLLEGLPLTLLEAISHSTPVLASNIPPHQEVITDPADGQALFEVGDLASLRQGLADALGSPAPSAASLQRFRDHTLPRYNWDVATDLLEQIYLGIARPVPLSDEPRQRFILKGTSTTSSMVPQQRGVLTKPRPKSESLHGV